MHYTHLIVGAGSAGGTLAGRLTARGDTQVLLLEAGIDYRGAETPEEMQSPNPNKIITAPQFEHFRYPQLKSARTAQQKHHLYWRGRGLGGSSAINGQIAIRGVQEDYDLWAEEGCDRWSYKHVLPYFNRLETDLKFSHKPYHGDTGPIPIYRASLNEWGSVDRALGESALDLGYPWAEDHNAPGALGVSPYAINNRDGRRVSTNDAYIEPARGNNNLTIRGNVKVDQVLFDGTTATGVVLMNGEKIYADTVILSSGAVHSPTILMRSGIGPAQHLTSLDIPLLIDLPVGEGFQDHPIVSFVIKLKDDYLPPEDFRHTNCCIRYSSGMEGAGPGDMLMVAMNRLGDSIGLKATESQTGFGIIGVWVNECFSRGNIKLASSDPDIEPIINMNMLSDQRDLARLRDGVGRLLDIANQPALNTISDSIVRAGDFQSIDTCNEGFDDWMLSNAGDTQHATCTCRMGAATDPRTVVDSDCKVLGTESLYVIDASVMPNVPRANTHLSVVMIAEKMVEKL